MKGKRVTNERITYALDRRRLDRRLLPHAGSWFSEASFYLRKNKLGKLGMTEVRKLRQLRDKKAQFERLVVRLPLNQHILREVGRKNTLGFTSAFR